MPSKNLNYNTPPPSAGDLQVTLDTIWIYISKWRPQISVKNCNKIQLWNLLTEERNSKFHLLERKSDISGKEKNYFIYNFQTKEWSPFNFEP